MIIGRNTLLTIGFAGVGYGLGMAAHRLATGFNPDTAPRNEYGGLSTEQHNMKTMQQGVGIVGGLAGVAILYTQNPFNLMKV